MYIYVSMLFTYLYTLQNNKIRVHCIVYVSIVIIIMLDTLRILLDKYFVNKVHFVSEAETDFQHIHH